MIHIDPMFLQATQLSTFERKEMTGKTSGDIFTKTDHIRLLNAFN